MVTIYSPSIGPTSEVDTQPDDNGQFPTSVAGVTVPFDELPATLLSASRNQVRAVAPYGIAGRKRVLVAILDSSGRTLVSRIWGVDSAVMPQAAMNSSVSLKRSASSA